MEKVKEEFEEFSMDLSDIKLEKNPQRKKTAGGAANKIEFDKRISLNKQKEVLRQKNAPAETTGESGSGENAEEIEEEFDLNNINIKKGKSSGENKEKKVKRPSPLIKLARDFLKKTEKKLEEIEDEQKEDVKYVNSLYSAANENVSYSINTVFTILVAVIVSLVIWANIAHVDELTRGEGKVIPSSKLQNVQSFDGGIVSEILVKDGEYVKKGQPLMRIDTTRFQATFEENEEALLSLTAKKVRLEAELNTDYAKEMKKLVFNGSLTENGDTYIKNQQKVYKSRFLERQNTLKIIRLQEKQKKQELKEILSKKEQLEETLVLMEEELDTITKMVNSGSKSKVELIQIKKEYNNMKGELRAVELSIPRTKLSIEESTAQIHEKLQSFKSDISQELEKTSADIKVIQAKMVSDNDKLEKTVIKSPVNGTIKQININTIGSVVKTGENLIEIVPDSDTLLVETKIDPKDIAFINPNSKTMVKLTAYDFSIYGGLEGKIVEISADSIKDIDSKDNKSYYKVVVKTDKNYLEHKGEKLTVIPGMVAQVDIITGKKSIMDFFLKPIIKVKEGAFHER